MAIKNNPVTTDREDINQMRFLIEQRAEWLYEICQEAEKRGEDWEAAARAGIFTCGCRRGKRMVDGFEEKGRNLKELAGSFQNNPNTTVFEKEYITVTEDMMEVDFHYCPLVACWQKLTDDEKKIAKFCDIAMDGDRGMFSAVPDSEFILASTLAEGAPVCKMIVRKLQK